MVLATSSEVGMIDDAARRHEQLNAEADAAKRASDFDSGDTKKVEKASEAKRMAETTTFVYVPKDVHDSESTTIKRGILERVVQKVYCSLAVGSMTGDALSVMMGSDAGIVVLCRFLAVALLNAMAWDSATGTESQRDQVEMVSERVGKGYDGAGNEFSSKVREGLKKVAELRNLTKKSLGTAHDNFGLLLKAGNAMHLFGLYSRFLPFEHYLEGRKTLDREFDGPNVLDAVYRSDGAGWRMLDFWTIKKFVDAVNNRVNEALSVFRRNCGSDAAQNNFAAWEAWLEERIKDHTDKSTQYGNLFSTAVENYPKKKEDGTRRTQSQQKVINNFKDFRDEARKKLDICSMLLQDIRRFYGTIMITKGAIALSKFQGNELDENTALRPFATALRNAHVLVLSAATVAGFMDPKKKPAFNTDYPHIVAAKVKLRNDAAHFGSIRDSFEIVGPLVANQQCNAWVVYRVQLKEDDKSLVHNQSSYNEKGLLEEMARLGTVAESGYERVIDALIKLRGGV